jgi:antitoxin ParD1/3/4
MRTLTIHLTEDARRFVEEQASAGGYGSADEFVQSLVREEQKRLARAKLEEMLVEGLESGKGAEVTDTYLQSLERRMRARVDSHRPNKGGKMGRNGARRVR